MFFQPPGECDEEIPDIQFRRAIFAMRFPLQCESVRWSAQLVRSISRELGDPEERSLDASQHLIQVSAKRCNSSPVLSAPTGC